MLSTAVIAQEKVVDKPPILLPRIPFEENIKEANSLLFQFL